MEGNALIHNVPQTVVGELTAELGHRPTGNGQIPNVPFLHKTRVTEFVSSVGSCSLLA